MDPTRVLVVYYSRTGTTETVARAIRLELGCEIEAIHDAKHRSGVLGYIRSGMDAALRRPAKLLAMSSDPDDYDLVIVGTPIWNATVSAPVRTYLLANRERIRRVAFFCTHGGSGSERVLREMQELCVQPPVATLVLRTEEVRRDGFAPKIRSFVTALNGAMASSDAASRAWTHDLPPVA
jgi:flavodoxin